MGNLGGLVRYPIRYVYYMVLGGVCQASVSYLILNSNFMTLNQKTLKTRRFLFNCHKSLSHKELRKKSPDLP